LVAVKVTTTMTVARARVAANVPGSQPLGTPTPIGATAVKESL